MSEINSKRVMLAALSSGSGKTTVTCGLLEVLKKRGLSPVSFKCGPDYIDPMFHKKVLGIDSRNLDTFFWGADGAFSAMSSVGDGYAVIEGVMGLYDGTGPEGIRGSGYEIASLLETPIILIADASGAGRTMISLIKGVLMDDTQHLIKGIILNRISESFYLRLKPVMEKELAEAGSDVKLLGFLPKNPEISIESRHLGLKLPGEIDGVRDKVSTAASMLEKNVDMEALISIMESAKKLEVKQNLSKAVDADTGNCDLTLAVASDDAFCFYYRENLELFEEMGVSIKFFSPLNDKELPEECDGILLGGGYPENYLKELSSNKTMLASIKNALDGGIPSLAECGGYMYLHKSITGMDGVSYDMAGVVEGDCTYTGHLVRFGYMEVEALNDASQKDADPLSESLVGMRGHEFHYYESSADESAYRAVKPDTGKTWECMVIKNNGIWGFPHFYYRSNPEFIEQFVKRMREVKNG